MLINQNAAPLVNALAGARSNAAFMIFGEWNMGHRAAWRQERDTQSSEQERAEREQDERDARGMEAQRALVGQRPIDLPALVVAVLDGRVGNHPMTQLATMDGACEAVVAVLASTIGRALFDGERAKVYIETGCEYNRRRQAQGALCSPFAVFAGGAS
jgi:hypothetical protein